MGALVLRSGREINAADPKTMDSAIEPLIESIITHQKEILKDLENLEELSENDKELIDEIRGFEEKLPSIGPDESKGPL